MKLADLPTPCLVLDMAILRRNLARMAAVAARHGVSLRPHMKTAKSIDVARLAVAGQPGGITVSTLAEAEYFAAHGIADILYAVGITPRKLEQVDKLNEAGASVIVATDDLDAASAIAARPKPPRALIEIDTGEARGGVPPGSDALLAIAGRLGPALAGVMTHAGQSYGARSADAVARVAEQERAGVTLAAERLRAAGHAAPTVSLGSSPTAVHAASMQGVTELRAGVYMFGDLMQAALLTHATEDIALTVLAGVIGRKPDRMLLDAGALALSKDRGLPGQSPDHGYGLVLDAAGRRAWGDRTVSRVFQEHGVIDDAGSIALPIGGLVRIAPNHACLTAAAHDRYYVVDGSDEVINVWTRVNGW